MYIQYRQIKKNCTSFGTGRKVSLLRAFVACFAARANAFYNLPVIFVYFVYSAMLISPEQIA